MTRKPLQWLAVKSKTTQNNLSKYSIERASIWIKHPKHDFLNPTCPQKKSNTPKSLFQNSETWTKWGFLFLQLNVVGVRACISLNSYFPLSYDYQGSQKPMHQI